MDCLQKLFFPNAPARGVTVALHKESVRMLEHLNLPVAVKRLLREVAAVTLMVAAEIEHDGSIQFQIEGDGPVRLLVAQVSPKNAFRVTAAMREGAGEIDPNADMTSLVNVSGCGRCALMIDFQHRRKGEIYQGIVPLVGKTFSEAAENYFRTSEQVETVIEIAADDEAVGGLMIQKMPAQGGKSDVAIDPEAWERIVMFLRTVKSEELLTLSPLEINRRLFSEENPRVTQEEEALFRCTCSEEALRHMIRSIGKEEAEKIIAEEGKITVTCSFCGRQSVFDAIDIEALFAGASSHPTQN